MSFEPLPPLTPDCLRADVRLPVSESPTCNQYDTAGNVTHTFLYPPSTYQCVYTHTHAHTHTELGIHVLPSLWLSETWMSLQLLLWLPLSHSVCWTHTHTHPWIFTSTEFQHLLFRSHQVTVICFICQKSAGTGLSEFTLRVMRLRGSVLFFPPLLLSFVIILNKIKQK